MKFFLSLYKLFKREMQVLDDIREHLLSDGIKKNYTTWIWHGKLIDMQRESQSEPLDVQMRDFLEEMIDDLGQESFQQARAPMLM